MISYYQIQTADVDGATEPVDIADMKRFMAVDYSDHDELISSLITECRVQLQQETNRVYVPSLVTLNVTTGTPYDAIDLPHYSNATGFTITDLDGDSILLTPDEYKVVDALLLIDYEGSYSITYTETPKVPASIVHALKLLVTHRYKYRGDGEKEVEMPDSVQRLIDKNVKVWL